MQVNKTRGVALAMLAVAFALCLAPAAAYAATGIAVGKAAPDAGTIAGQDDEAPSIDDWYYDVATYSLVVGSGIPEVDFYYYDDQEEVYPVKGVDFELTLQRRAEADSEGDEGSWENYSKETLDEGEYRFAVTGKGNFEGQHRDSDLLPTFSVFPANSLNLARLEFDPYERSSESEHQANIKVWMDGRDSPLVMGTDYKLAYTYHGTGEGDGSEVNGLSAVGEYYVEITPAEDSAFTGRNGVTMWVVEPIAISLLESSVQPNSEIDLDYNGQVWENLFLSYGEGDDVWSASLGDDYRLIFRAADDDDLAGSSEAPTEPGSYVVTVIGKGRLTGELKIPYRLVETAADNGTYEIDDDYFRLKRTIYAATGDSITPEYDTWLTEDTDFVVSYEDVEGQELEGPPSDLGAYVMVFTGINDYEGEVRFEFSIVDSNDISAAEVVIWGLEDLYEGSGITELGEALYIGEQQLLLDEDYEFVRYEDESGSSVNKSFADLTAGAYVAVFRGIGAYDGQLRIEFKILDPWDLSNAVVDDDATLGELSLEGVESLAPVTGVSMRGVPLQEGEDYQVVYFRVEWDEDADNYTYEEVGNTITEPGRYVYQIVAGMSGQYKSSDRSDDRAFDVYDVAPKRFEINVTDARVDERGTYYLILSSKSDTVSPVIEVYLDGQKVAEELYEITYDSADGEGPLEPPLGAGDYWVTVAGVGELSNIEAASIELMVTDAMAFEDLFSFDDRYLFDLMRWIDDDLDLPETLELENGAVLNQGRHFAYRFSSVDENPEEAEGLSDVIPNESGRYSVYAVALEGSGYSGWNRCGDIEIIDPNELGSGLLQIVDGKYAYTGDPVVPSVQFLRYSDDFDSTIPVEDMEEGKQYAITTYYDAESAEATELEGPPSEPGYYSAKIEARSPYTGAVLIYFHILASNDLGLAKLNWDWDASYAYTGQPVTPFYALSMGGTRLVEGIDFEVSYYTENGRRLSSPPVNPGLYSFGAAGINNYKGSVDGWHDGLSFQIVKDEGRVAEPEFIESFAYDGQSKSPAAAGVGYELSGTTSAIDPGTYTVTATLQDGYEWLDGSTDPITCTWSIAKLANGLKFGAKASNATHTLAYKATTQVIPAASAYTVSGAQGAVTFKKASGSPALTVAADGTVTLAKGAKPATYSVVVTATAAGDATHAAASKNVALTVKVNKADNPVTVKAKTATVKASKVKKKAQTVTAKKAFTVSKAQGKVAYKKKSGNKKIAVASNGKVTVKKGLKKGTYKVKVAVTAKGNANYKAATKNVTLKVKVK